ncbi:MAG: DNA alkylation repair protein [Lachnospiraceae bacterium]|nr:DNA alkylation repair protein [Lachnospiraceae bacterium]
MEKITKELFALRDESYFQFHKKLIPEIPEENIMGVRTPVLRAYAKEVAKRPEAYAFLQELPHTYYEENNLHGALLGLLYKDVENYLQEVEKFLPYIDNWATCDMMGPKVFKKNLPLVYEHVKKWIASGDTYTVRFGIVTLLGYFLEDAFLTEMLDLAAGINSEEYYIKMAVAWYFSMALVKQYDAAIPYLQKQVMPTWTHNKAIQKAIESRQIDETTKDYLRTLKV